ncbi:MAG: bifunctional riboflavin kinase/FAD synthetase [Microbacteriaceae bacterium]
MLFFDSLSAVPDGFGPSAVAIGKFDGVHAGHRRMIARLLAHSSAAGLVATAITFDRNPLSVIRPQECPIALLSNAQKVELLAATGLEATLMLPFDRELSELSPEEFVRAVLVDGLRATRVIVGTDFRFGNRGVGTTARLIELGELWGFSVEVIDDVVASAAGQPERRASSTWVRELLTQGDVRQAAIVLGALPTIRSVVVHGAQRGRELGYPTANLSPQIEGYIPADGVYAAWLTVAGTRYGCAVSIGNNPTFEGIPDKQVEAHVLDEKLDLYGATVDIAFVEYIRPMNKFSGVDALVAQMNVDEKKIRHILGYPAAVGKP